ncbi:hypothetical protein AVEN_74797-1 [Araneus ventricosus]|uniref:Uncharacterized protein n=1 Tax=Araneus ventricosus TaxID=182803 RepID=A0A4Y2RN10_ARAVE|nr:hypothetical protein AVEN_74797-1 [Araneus ventricosus]
MYDLLSADASTAPLKRLFLGDKDMNWTPPNLGESFTPPHHPYYNLPLTLSERGGGKRTPTLTIFKKLPLQFETRKIARKAADGTPFEYRWQHNEILFPTGNIRDLKCLNLTQR